MDKTQVRVAPTPRSNENKVKYGMKNPDAVRLMDALVLARLPLLPIPTASAHPGTGAVAMEEKAGARLMGALPGQEAVSTIRIVSAPLENGAVAMEGETGARLMGALLWQQAVSTIRIVLAHQGTGAVDIQEKATARLMGALPRQQAASTIRIVLVPQENGALAMVL